jgi:hypothetical protein
MSGLATLCNAGPLIKIDGKSYQLRGRTLRHLGEAESQIILLRGDLLFFLRKAVKGLDHEDAVGVVEKIIQKIRFRWIGCTNEDIYRWYSCLEGRVYSFWQSIRDNGLAYEECVDLYFKAAQVDEDWESSIKWSIETLTGESEISNLYRIGGMYRSVSDFDDEYLISRACLFSILFKAPFGYTFDQIADMTMGQTKLMFADNDKPRTDLKDEKMILDLPKNPGTRKMLSGYTKTYRELAENLVSGLSLTSGLKQ